MKRALLILFVAFFCLAADRGTWPTGIVGPGGGGAISGVYLDLTRKTADLTFSTTGGPVTANNNPIIKKNLGPATWSCPAGSVAWGCEIDHLYDIPIEVTVRLQVMGYGDGTDNDLGICDLSGAPTHCTWTGELGIGVNAACASIAMPATANWNFVGMTFHEDAMASNSYMGIENHVTLADGDCVGMISDNVTDVAGVSTRWGAGVRMIVQEHIDPTPQVCEQALDDTVDFAEACDNGTLLGQAMLAGVITNRGSAAESDFTIGVWGSTSASADIVGASFTAINVTGQQWNIFPPTGHTLSDSGTVNDDVQLDNLYDSMTCIFDNATGDVWKCSGDALDED